MNIRMHFCTFQLFLYFKECKQHYMTENSNSEVCFKTILHVHYFLFFHIFFLGGGGAAMKMQYVGGGWGGCIWIKSQAAIFVFFLKCSQEGGVRTQQWLNNNIQHLPLGPPPPPPPTKKKNPRKR